MDLRVVVVYPFGGGNNKANLLVRVVRHRMEERSADHKEVRRECQQGKHEAQRAGRLDRLHLSEYYPVPLSMSNAAAGAVCIAEGDPVEIARTMREALALTGTPAQDPPGGVSERFPLDTAQISRILGHGGNVSGGVYHVSVPRA